MYAHARIELMSWFNANGPAQAHVRWKAKTLRNGYCPDHNILAKTFFFFVGHFATIISVTRTFRVKCYNLFSIFFFVLFAIRWAMSDAKAFIHSSSYFIVSYRTVSFVYRIKRGTMIKLSCWFWLSAVIYIDHTTSYVVCVCVWMRWTHIPNALCVCVCKNTLSRIRGKRIFTEFGQFESSYASAYEWRVHNSANFFFFFYTFFAAWLFPIGKTRSEKR